MRSGNDKDRGLYRKFHVSRVDRSSRQGGKHHGCEYFVLDLNHDQFAPAALRAYAFACAKDFPALAHDLWRKFPGLPNTREAQELKEANEALATTKAALESAQKALADRQAAHDKALAAIAAEHEKEVEDLASRLNRAIDDLIVESQSAERREALLRAEHDFVMSLQKQIRTLAEFEGRSRVLANHKRSDNDIPF